MKNICIIPARGGSKRVKNKNILNLYGKPIIAYAIEKAISSKLFDKILVSTDSVEIKKVALQYGAEVPFIRSNKNSDDFATTSDVLYEVLIKLAETGLNYDNICCLYPTSVLFDYSYLEIGLKKMLNSDVNSVITLKKYSHPIQRAINIKNECAFWNNQKFEFTRTQDCQEYFFDAGQFYWNKIKSFLVEKKLLTSKSGYIILKENESVDLDIFEDFDILKYKFDKNNFI